MARDDRRLAVLLMLDPRGREAFGAGDVDAARDLARTFGEAIARIDEREA
jgi:hypothetical protein